MKFDPATSPKSERELETESLKDVERVSNKRSIDVKSAVWFDLVLGQQTLDRNGTLGRSFHPQASNRPLIDKVISTSYSQYIGYSGLRG